jgi:hypothetical protein
VASKDIMLEAKNEPRPDALTHLLLSGITAGVLKEKSKVEPGMERSEAKARKGNGNGKGRRKSNNQFNCSSKEPCWYFNTDGTCCQGDNCKFFHDGAHDSSEVAAATTQSITDKITNRVMDSIKKGRRGRKKIPVMVV